MLNYLKTRKVDPVPALVAVFHPLGPISLTGVLKTFGVSVLINGFLGFLDTETVGVSVEIDGLLEFSKQNLLGFLLWEIS